MQKSHSVTLVLHVMLTRRDRNIPKHQPSGLCRHYVLLWVWAPVLHNTRHHPDCLNLTFHHIYEELLTSSLSFFIHIKSRSSSGRVSFDEDQSVRRGRRQTALKVVGNKSHLLNRRPDIRLDLVSSAQTSRQPSSRCD